jgi:hypothetical protein
MCSLKQAAFISAMTSQVTRVVYISSWLLGWSGQGQSWFTWAFLHQIWAEAARLRFPPLQLICGTAAFKRRRLYKQPQPLHLIQSHLKRDQKFNLERHWPQEDGSNRICIWQPGTWHGKAVASASLCLTDGISLENWNLVDGWGMDAYLSEQWIGPRKPGPVQMSPTSDQISWESSNSVNWWWNRCQTGGGIDAHLNAFSDWSKKNSLAWVVPT